VADRACVARVAAVGAREVDDETVPTVPDGWIEEPVVVAPSMVAGDAD
jgi:hypothetical protein